MPAARFYKLPQERQDAILDAAATEFAAKGYEGSSYNQIIEQSGVSKGSMYYYFEGKQDLYGAVLMRLGQTFIARIGIFKLEPDAKDAETFWRQAEEMSIRTIEYYADYPAAAGLLRSLLSRPHTEETKGTVATMRAAWEAWWAMVLKVGQDCGAIRTDLPNSLMIRLLVAVCDAVDAWCIERIDKLSLEDWREISRMLADSLRQMGDVSAEDEARRHLWRRFDT
jgi:TetR/AcrR family transcriptional regulator, transcriptional repressor of aconitase